MTCWQSHRPGVIGMLAMAMAMAIAGCTGPDPAGVAAGSPDTGAAPLVPPAPPVTLADATAAADPAPPMPRGRWFLQGGDDDPRAVWGVPDSEGTLMLRCDHDQGRLVLEREATGLPAHARLLAIEADGTRMNYPAERVDTGLGTSLVTSIALDAPILDRMLTASRLTVQAGDSTLVTTSPATVLAPVVAACRARY